ncbi:MAG: Holliday junction branch migration protein RuvA [Gammaproteobacteria bacterium]|nr:MAG: Holliday junction branch migration protein RuvA [Gammaproteobacteria bacterium]
MIGRIRGILIENEAPILLIEAAGIAYEVQAPLGTCCNLTMLGEEVILHTHLSISENAHQLYGFISLRDRRLFKNLIKISGIGPKLGLAILSGMDTEQFVACINASEVSLLVKIPGVGKKTAERLVVEMRDKLKDWSSDVTMTTSGKAATNAAGKISIHGVMIEVQSALVSLGYKPQDASKVVSRLAEEHDFTVTSSEELIRLALKGSLV